MDRTITVKGSARLSLQPDTIEITLSLNKSEKQYEAAVTGSAAQLRELQDCVSALGFDRKELVTTYFNIGAEYEYTTDKKGVGHRVLTGYRASHNLRLDMPFDTERMAKVLAAFAASKAEPDFNLNFTVKDRDAVKDELLEQAAASARHKAEVLTRASGAQLGSLLQINYNWGDMNFYSATNYGMERKCMAAVTEEDCAMEISPDRIELNDSASFVYEIIG